MAFQLEISTPTGTDATYWRVLRVDLPDQSRRADVLVGGFASQAASDEVRQLADGRSLDERRYSFTGDAYDALVDADPSGYASVRDAVLTAAYVAVKARTVTVANPAYDPGQPEGPGNEPTVEEPGEFAAAQDV